MANSILIADDSEVIRRTLRNLIAGYKELSICGEAENGQEAVEKAHRLKPDLVLIDFSMPVMNGLEAASHLKKVQGQVPRGARLQSRSQPRAFEGRKYGEGGRLCPYPAQTGYPQGSGGEALTRRTVHGCNSWAQNKTSQTLTSRGTSVEQPSPENCSRTE